MSDDQKAKERRAKQTVNNLLLSLLATAGLVLLVILVVPRDDSSRIQKVDYVSIAQQAATSSARKIVIPDLPKGWWSNKAEWLSKPIDAVPRFESGFVGPKNEYLGITQAFGVNPTWTALTLKDVVLEKNFSNSGSPIKWSIYKSPVVHDPVKTMDVIWAGSFGNDEVLLYGTATENQFKTFTQTIEKQLEGK